MVGSFVRVGSAVVPLQIREWMPPGAGDKRREDRFARTGDGTTSSATRQEDEVTVLMVDAANVVGARPDGWWRDRAGATERLLGRLAGCRLTAPDGSPITEVVAVVEGRARDVTAPEGVRLVRAEGSGDDALVACAEELTDAGAALVVVSADRGLRARLPGGVPVVGPGWLLAELDESANGPTPT
jgi:hypothetical protein